MGTPQPVRKSRQTARPAARPADLAMSREDWQALRDAIANVFDHEIAAGNVLERIGFPRDQRPTWSGNPGVVWAQVFTALDKGIIQFPHRDLLGAALTVYPFNPTFRELGERYGVTRANAPLPAAETTAEAAADEAASDETIKDEAAGGDRVRARAAGAQHAPRRTAAAEAVAAGAAADDYRTCHVIVRAGSEEERKAAAQVLTELGLDPHDVWATAYATSFQVGSADASRVRGLLDPTGMSWVVVPAGANDYLIRELFVSGPDGRRFRLIDAPAQQTVADVAAGIVDQYGPSFSGRSRPTVMDRVLPDGQGQRLSPDSTLHDAGVRDGSSLRLGFEATAGAVNPMDHQDALHRMRNQILHFAKSRPDMAVRGIPLSLPSNYEISFVQRSLGPPAQPDGDPVPVTKHVVQVQFRADFPETPPLVFWISPIFHPNIWPQYDCEAARRHPLRQGLVCLGALAASYTPALSFANLCQTLIDMAAYRNYTVQRPTGVVATDGSEELADDYYDRAAAEWAYHHQAEIEAMGGSPMIRRSGVTKPYANAIEAVD